MFSKACEYGIKATIFIAHQSQQGKRVSLKEIAEAIDSPVAFTAKTLQLLAKNNVILSIKGAAGGYEIPNSKFKTITLCQVVTAIDGDHIYHQCGLGLKECNPSKPCPVHNDFKEIRDRLEKMLKTTSLQKLVAGLDDGLAFLKN